MKNISMRSDFDGVDYEAEQAPQKGIVEETTRPPLVPSEKNNAANGRPKTREVTSRYKAGITSPSRSTPDVRRRCPSPNVTRTVSTSSPSLPKRAQSVGRRRPSTPPSPPRPSTPVQDTSAETHTSSRRMSGRTPEGLWPSTMRSLCVSFQSDTFSLPITKREKPVSHASDHTLKPSSNVAYKQAESPAVQRKATPEKKRNPLRGKNASDQSENSKPVDNSYARVIDHHKWPSATGGKLSPNVLTRSVDLTDRSSRRASFPLPVRGVSPVGRPSTHDGLGKRLQKTACDVAKQITFDDSGRVEFERDIGDDSSLRLSGIHKSVPSSVGVSLGSSERTLSTTRTSRCQRLPSPSKALSTPSRGVSPSRTRSSNPSISSLTNRSSNSASVLSFITDVRKGKKAMNHIEEAHQLRLLYNRYLQWRYTNARADTALSVQRVTAERTLFNVWINTSDLWDSVTTKRIKLQQLRQELKLKSVLNEQLAYLEDWALLESDHLSSLSGAIEALEASTLRLPVTGGARGDIQTVKDAICSAVDVIQAMGSSICSLLSRVEGINHFVSELADIATQERAVLDECEDLLASTTAMQIEENSLRTHLIQLRQASRRKS
ncbi:PREDICTED: AUGMIN subunit 8-like [Nelumbo nucifera]|uniref:AUGMIN subunit 8-like n=1 Tax=Nelumbo nucifera TaxID=4432 RepID=A0A1U8AR98_NELNU|nr:PREDICTED: AUGMIN subunit 8-like [Nelumbo nucifera]XP_010265521.1 PREDICTED: AUGMIN subunit 8-like [Nelumbo nucifera]